MTTTPPTQPRHIADIAAILSRHQTGPAGAVEPYTAPRLDRDETAAWNRARAMAYFASRQNTPPRFADATITHDGVHDWVTRYLLTGGKLDSLMLQGNVGSGKTHNAYGALRAIAESGTRPVKWISTTVPDFYARLRPSSGLDFETEFNRFADAELLLLDDLGAAKVTEWTEEVMFMLIERRYAHILPTIFTTNLPTWTKVSDLGERAIGLDVVVGQRTMSRITQMCTWVEIRGDDWRYR